MWEVEGKRGVKYEDGSTSGTGEAGRLRIVLPSFCLSQTCSLPFHCSAPCHRANPANPTFQTFSPTLVQVGSASGKHWLEGGEPGDGRSQCIFPPHPAVYSGTCSRAGGWLLSSEALCLPGSHSLCLPASTS